MSGSSNGWVLACERLHNLNRNLKRVLKGWPAALLVTALAAPPALAATEPAEALLRQAAQAAVWPGDILRAAERYLDTYPAGPSAAEMRTLMLRVGDAWRVVSRSDVRLYRGAFVASDEQMRADLRRAALGDGEAAVRQARDSLAHDEAHGTQRYVGWLQYASVLGHQQASYELALYFRRTDQPLLAAHYEAQALAQGYEPAAALDHARK